MRNINIHKLYYHLRHRYVTLNNIVIAVAVVIGVSWAWGSIGMMQRNYTLQKELELQSREQKVAELQVAMLAYQQKYYQSSEYQELSAREHLGLADPGEKVLILPVNSAGAKAADAPAQATDSPITPPGNFQQWMNFLFGGARRDLQK